MSGFSKTVVVFAFGTLALASLQITRGGARDQETFTAAAALVLQQRPGLQIGDTVSADIEVAAPGFLNSSEHAIAHVSRQIMTRKETDGNVCFGLTGIRAPICVKPRNG